MIADRQYVQFLSYVPKVLYCTVVYCSVLSYVPKVLLALIIPMFDDVYHKVAVWLNDMGESVSKTLLLFQRYYLKVVKK